MLKMEDFQGMIEVARTKSINKAAEALYLSQSTLSQTLKDLEIKLGVRLLTRSYRGVELTEAGQEFVNYARQILALEEKAEGIGSRKLSSRFSVSSIYSFTMLDLFEEFSRTLDASKIQIFYEEIPNRQIAGKVAAGQSDLGLIYLLSQTESETKKHLKEMGLEFTALCREPLYAVVGKDHPLAGRQSVTIEELQDYPLLVEKIKNEHNEKGQEDNLLFPYLFQEHHKMPIVFDNNRSLMYYLTKSDECFSVGQKSLNLSNPFLMSDSLRYLPIDQEGIYTVTGAIHKKSEETDPNVEAFLHKLKQYFLLYGQDQVRQTSRPKQDT